MLYRKLLRDFRPPHDPQARIWRFMSFAKYIALLEGEAVFFARADTLGDHFEGSQSRKTVRERERFRGIVEKNHGTLGGSENARQLTFISCWHLNDRESEQMWKLYSGGSESECVAVQTRFNLLRAALEEGVPEDDERYWPYVGCVAYSDYESDQFCDDWVTPYIHKRKNFEHEKEVRAIIFLHRDRPPKAPSPEELRPGISVPVKLNDLIEGIFTSPSAASWFHELVRSVSEKFGLSAPVSTSELTVPPVY